MDIKISEHSGFCSGVRQALNQVKAAAIHSKGPIYTWGPLVHNPRVIAELEEKGITAITNFHNVPPGTILIRAHGVPPKILNIAKELDFNIIDATCPFVRSCQNVALKLASEKKDIVVVGKRGHPEVVGICGWAENKALVVENPAEARALRFNNTVGVLAQTTQNKENFVRVADILRTRAPKLELYETICGATQLRQEAARKLAKEVEVVIVIGGYHSANTFQLVNICRQAGAKVYHIELAVELRREWLRGKYKVGVIAGASTPDVSIEEVVRLMKEYQENQNIEDMYASTFKPLQEGETVTGKVVRIDNDEVLVDIGYKSEGIIPLQELSDKIVSSPEDVVAIGDEIKVSVVKIENSEGNPILSKKRVDYEEAWRKLEEAYETGVPIEGEVLQVVKGGLIVFIGIRAFLPASHVGLRYEPNLEKFVGQMLRIKVIELEQSRNMAIVSHKLVLEEELAEKRAALWEELVENQVRKGTVTKLTDFGAFVDLGGIEGLVHISELSWARVKHPSEVLQEGEEIEVMVLGVDRERERVSLGLKQVLPDPWEGVTDRYPIGVIQPGIVTHLVSFGVFVQLEPGVEGLIHISQLANRRIAEPSEVVQVGAAVNVNVLEINEKDRRISLSMKDVEQGSEENDNNDNYEHAEEKDEFPGGMLIGEVLEELIQEKQAEEAKDDEKE